MGQSVLDELEKIKSLLNEAKKLPFSKYVSIDREEFLIIINRIEMLLPKEVKEAYVIQSKRDDVLREAYAEREKMLGEIKDMQKEALSESYITKEAQKEREMIIQDARADSEKIKKEAENYAYEILMKIESIIEKAKSAIEEGKKELKDDNTNREDPFK